MSAALAPCYRYARAQRRVDKSTVGEAHQPQRVSRTGQLAKIRLCRLISARSHSDCAPPGPIATLRGGKIDASDNALVDDDQNILTSVSMALEAEGFRVHTYKDGEDAFRGLSRQPVDLAADIKMPRMDGMELLQNLRRSSQMPIIFLTSKDDEVDEVLGLRMGRRL